MTFRDGYFFASLFLSRLADQVVLFIVPLIIFQLTESASLSALVFFLETLPRFCTFPIAGILSDYFSPYTLLKHSQLLRFAVIPFGLVGYQLSENYIFLIIISALIGILTSAGLMAREVILPQAFASGRFEKVLSFTSLADQTGTVLGPMLAALLMTSMSWQVALIITAVLFIIADLAVHIWWQQTKPNVRALDTSDIHFIKPLMNACQTIISLPSLMMAILMAFAVNLIMGTLMATVVPIYTGEFQQSEASYASLQTAGAVATILVLAVVAHFRLSLKFLGLFSFVLICLGGLVTVLSHHIAWYTFGFLVVIGFDKMFSVFVRGLRRYVIPPAHMGKTTGIIILLNNLSQPLAGLIIAMTTGLIGLHTINLTLVLIATFVGSLVLIFLMKNKHLFKH